jgi:high-affinity nickel-transport protein
VPMESEAEVRLSLLRRISLKAASYHERVPVARSLPLASILIIAALILVNIIVWIGCGIVLV